MHYCLQELHILPSVLFALPRRELALVIASCEARIEAEKKHEQELKRKNH